MAIPLHETLITSKGQKVTGSFLQLEPHEEVPRSALVLSADRTKRYVYDNDTSRQAFQMFPSRYHNIGLPSNLLPHQKQIIQHINQEQIKRACLIAPMGAGKSLIALTIASSFSHTLIVAPKAVLTALQREQAKHNVNGNITYSTYESAPTDKHFDCLICDEILKVKNPNTKIHKRLYTIAHAIQYRFGFLAHPISAKAGLDLRFFNILLDDWIEPDSVQFTYEYAKNPRWEKKEISLSRNLFCSGLVHDGWQYTKLLTHLAPFILHIPSKEIVIPNNVKRETIVLPTPPQFGHVCRGVYADFDFSRVPSQKRTITSGFVYNADGSANDLNDIKERWVLDFLKNRKSKGKVIIFSAYTREMERLEAHLNIPCIRAGKDYNAEIEKFNKTGVLCISAHLSEGLNLQCADTIIFMSNSSSPVKKLQAEGRIIRPYNPNDTLYIYELVCKDTMDEEGLQQLDNHITEDSKILGELDVKKNV